MSNELKINVSGGNAIFGNVSQGDQNTEVATNQGIAAPTDQAFADFFAALDKRSAQADQIAALREQVTALQAALDQGRTDKLGSVVKAAKEIYEKYGWAGDLLKKLFELVVPGWLAS